MKVIRAGTVGRVDGAPANLVVDDPLRDQEVGRRAVGEPPGIESRGDVAPFGPGCRLPDERHARGGVVVLVAPAPGSVGRRRRPTPAGPELPRTPLDAPHPAGEVGYSGGEQRAELPASPHPGHTR